MTDVIHIRGLRVRTRLGVREQERRRLRPVIIDIDLHAETGRRDRLDETVDYQRVADRVAALARGATFRLVERLADAIAAVCLKERGVESVRVTVEKPGALKGARSAAVTVERP
jgi:FolB domain-containing protein